MNKKLLILLLLFAGMADAQVVNIPNALFRTMLLISGNDVPIALDAAQVPMQVDANGDGLIQQSEAAAVHALYLGNLPINDLTGISSFTNLRQLNIPNNQLTALDVTVLPNLTRLDCSGNQLTSLNVSNMPNLEFVFCDSNNISNLSFAGATGLRFLSCNGNNLSSLNVSGLQNLLFLGCSNNQLSSLPLSNLPLLSSLQCDHNQLTSLDVSNLPSLTQLFCFYNLLTSLDLTAAPNLTHVSCGENNLAQLNLNGLTQLTALECSYLPNNAVINGLNLDSLQNFLYTGQNSSITLNGFPSIQNLTLQINQPTIAVNISGFSSTSTINLYGSSVSDLSVNGVGTVNLQALNISNNHLTSLSLSGLGNLSQLDVANNSLVNLNLSGLDGLTNLICSRNQLATLNLNGLQNLKLLDCDNNKLSSLNLSALPLLEYLDCSNDFSFSLVGNQLTSLNLSAVPNLKYLDCSNYQFSGQLGALGNLITSLSVNSLVHLQQLKCSKNNIGTLVVNGLAELTTLDCSHNQLASLDLIGLTGLTTLNYSHNQLSNLNMAGLVNITDLDCSNNDIETLTVTNMPNLKHLACNDNALSTLNLSGLNLIETLHCNSNQLTALDLSAMPLLTALSCQGNQLASLDANSCPNLVYLSCGVNQLTSLNVSALTQLDVLNCSHNQLSTLDVSSLLGLNELNCSHNLLTSLDVSACPDINYLSCFENQLSSLDVSNLADLLTLSCRQNQLTALDVSTATKLYGLYCDDNLLTSLDVSAQTDLTELWCKNNSLSELFMKNGSFETSLQLSGNPGLAYICADDAQLSSVQSQLNGLGMTATVCNSYCTFSPGGPHNTVIGTTIFDGNNNGCNINDPLHPNIRVDFTDGTTTGSAFTNTEGVCTFYADAGNYTLFPNIENASAFSISPAIASVNFPNNDNNVSNVSFCLSPNGVNPDLEIAIAPIGAARPGFDALYELVFKNKGNQALSGEVTLVFDDARLDFVSASPAQDSQSASTLVWSYSGMLPFESRVIALAFNVNSPTETPAVNNGDILAFSAAITPATGDETPSDNAFAFNQTVVNSFDPNDITCLEGDSLSPSEIGNYLHYIVNFENTGTASAVNVIVRTEVDPSQYDLHSLQVMNTSHNARTVIRGNTVEFIFENIELGAAAGDPPVGGHGNVLFKIRSNDGLGQGDMVAKQAEIFFDYNFPIETNAAETVYESLKNPDFEADANVSVYPNPSSGLVTVKSASDVKLLELFDVQGRLLQQNLNSNAIDVSARANGMYFLRVTTGNGMKVEKIIRN